MAADNRELNMGQPTSRQQIISTEVNEPRMRNWLCATLAIRETSKAIAVCAHQQISKVHKRMQNVTRGLPACHQKCSQTIENPAQWCTTCDRWRKEILTMCEPSYIPQIRWTRLNSSHWPTNPYEVGRTFIPRAHRLYYKSAEFHEDLGFFLSLIENCTEIPIPRPLCEKVRVCRSKVKRKNVQMRMVRDELEVLISTLIELVTQPVFGNSEKVVSQLQALLYTFDDESDGCCLM